MKLGERIELRRAEIGISQSELARRVGVRQSTMNSLINGDSRTSRSIVKIAQVLNTSPAYLMGETDDPAQDAVSAAISSQDIEWLEMLHRLAPRERNAVKAMIAVLLGDFSCEDG